MELTPYATNFFPLSYIILQRERSLDQSKVKMSITQRGEQLWFQKGRKKKKK
jgi:hypothetical protein